MDDKGGGSHNYYINLPLIKLIRANNLLRNYVKELDVNNLRRVALTDRLLIIGHHYSHTACAHAMSIASTTAASLLSDFFFCCLVPTSIRALIASIFCLADVPLKLLHQEINVLRLCDCFARGFHGLILGNFAKCLCTNSWEICKVSL